MSKLRRDEAYHKSNTNIKKIVRTIFELEDTENYLRPPYTKMKLEVCVQRQLAGLQGVRSERRSQNGGHVELIKVRPSST